MQGRGWEGPHLNPNSGWDRSILRQVSGPAPSLDRQFLAVGNQPSPAEMLGWPGKTPQAARRAQGFLFTVAAFCKSFITYSETKNFCSEKSVDKIKFKSEMWQHKH